MLAPIPSASVTIAASVNAGLRRNPRPATIRSEIMDCPRSSSNSTSSRRPRSMVDSPKGITSVSECMHGLPRHPALSPSIFPMPRRNGAVNLGKIAGNSPGDTEPRMYLSQ